MKLLNYKQFNEGFQLDMFDITGITVKAYHYSSKCFNKFSMKFANSGAFGIALYFSNTSDIETKYFGTKLYSVNLKLNNCLNLNTELTITNANQLYLLYCKLNKIKQIKRRYIDSYNDYVADEQSDDIEYDLFDEDETIQFGTVLQDLIQDYKFNDSILNNGIPNLLKHLGYKSFMHYSDYETNFIENKNAQNIICYGILADNDVEILEYPKSCNYE